MRKINRKFGIVQLSALMVVAFFAATPTANAGEPLCELDWNCDGVVSDADFYEYVEGGLSAVQSRGFYADLYYYTVYHNTYPQYVDGGYYHEHFQCGSAGNLDWNGDGVIETADAYQGSPSAARLSNFYTQFYVWEYYNEYYSHYYPESDCGAFHLNCYNACAEWAEGWLTSKTLRALTCDPHCTDTQHDFTVEFGPRSYTACVNLLC